MDDATKLMLRVQKGDDQAFDQLLTQFREQVVNTMYRMVGRRADAEDLAQEVFVRIYQARKRYAATAKFSTWLFQIVRNLAFNYVRDQRRQKIVHLTTGEEEDDWENKFAEPSNQAPAARLETLELQDAIKQILDDLPPQQRAAIVLARFEGKQYREIAEILEVSVAAVKMLVQRGKSTLAKRLEPFLQGKNHGR